MEFVDRVSAYPNRYTITDENGNVSYAVIERADEPITPGTPLSAETFNAFLLCTESADHPGCYCKEVGDETEWLNPPMVENVEYRTTERYNGLPVYTKRVVFQDIPAKGESKIVTIFGAESRMLQIQAAAFWDDETSQTIPIPYFESGVCTVWLESNAIRHSLFPEEGHGVQLFLNRRADSVSFTADRVECTVKYVKG
jgi:hypothetical protein